MDESLSFNVPLIFVSCLSRITDVVFVMVSNEADANEDGEDDDHYL